MKLASGTFDRGNVYFHQRIGVRRSVAAGRVGPGGTGSTSAETKGALDLVNTAVSAHSRWIVDFSLDTEELETICPPEPVVAETAAGILSGADVWERTIHKAESFLRSVNKGLSGELATRLLAVLARDEVLAAAESCEFQFSQPFCVVDFTRALFTESETILQSKAIIRGAEQIVEEAFGQAYMDFSHFSSTEHPLNAANTLELMHNLLFTQSALQLCFNQSLWDTLTPIYYGDPKASFDRKKVSASPPPPRFSPTDALNRIGEERDILIHIADQEFGVPSVVSAVSYLYSTSPELCQKVAVVRIELFVEAPWPEHFPTEVGIYSAPQGSGTLIQYDGEYTAPDIIGFIASKGSTHSDASALALGAASEQFSAITEDAASLTQFVEFADNTCHIPSGTLPQIKATQDKSAKEPTKDGAFSTVGKGLESLLLQYAVQVAAQLTADAIGPESAA